MTGTFRPGDRLTIEPIPITSVIPGDVVAFSPPTDETSGAPWAHRVTAVTPDGLVTRGDNNPRADTPLVTEENLLGIVTFVERERDTRRVLGGRAGLWRARLLWSKRPVRNWLEQAGRWPYHVLRASGLVPLLWRPRIVRVAVTIDDGRLVKYVTGRRTVAWWWPEQDRFRCRKPYDLVISRPVPERNPCEG